MSLLALPAVPMHFGQTKVAVGDERAHAPGGLGKRQRPYAGSGLYFPSAWNMLDLDSRIYYW